MPATKGKGKRGGSRKRAKRGEIKNILRCRACKHWWRPEGKDIPPCPKCGGAVTLRCGSPRRKKLDEHPCFQGVAYWGGRCEIHGKKALKGPANPKWGTGKNPEEAGKHSVWVPARWRKAYDQAVRDPQKGEMVVDLGLLDAMRDETLRRVGTGESGMAWKRLGELGQKAERALDAMHAAAEAGDADRVAKAGNQLVDILEVELLPTLKDGVGEEAIRTELTDLIQVRARAARVQQLGQTQSQKMVPIETVVALLSRVTMIVTRHVPDRRTASALVEELRLEADRFEDETAPSALSVH